MAVFRYSPVDILSVSLPPSVMDFTNRVPLEWVREQIAEVLLYFSYYTIFQIKSTCLLLAKMHILFVDMHKSRLLVC